ncbi:MAG: hypothetical protein V2I33_26485, partial [Kangiellaceae bacterium]|nr:hypothetical protein [Kangiellaceae bacterium]
MLNRKPSFIGDGEDLTISSPEFVKAVYTGNVVSNAQAIVAKSIHTGEFANTGMDVSLNSIDGNTIQWIEALPFSFNSKLSTLVSKTGGWFCGGDEKYQVLTGVIGYDLENVSGATITASAVFNLVNKGGTGSLVCHQSFSERLHHSNPYEGYLGS